MDFWTRRGMGKHEQIPDSPTKRISTPAGQRLSVILENGSDTKTSRPRDAYRSSIRKSGAISGLGPTEEDMEGRSQDSSGYTYSVWSGASEKKFQALRNHRQIAKRGGWKRLAIIALLILAAIIALAVGLAFGLHKKSSSSSKSSDDSSSAAGAAATKTSGSSATGTAAASSSSSTPSNFPVGTWSMVTFLDTVETNCTSDPATWTCYPYTIYNTDPNKALATFNWQISSPSSGKYVISSTTNPFSITFSNQELELLDAGEDSERYRFQFSQTKTVSPSSSITGDNSAAECDYDGTTVQAYLYTKMAKTYPDTSAGQSSGDPSYTTWPYAVRVEQAVGGGTNVPSCYKTNNGVKGDNITDGLTAQFSGNLCDCLYKNWRTPT